MRFYLLLLLFVLVAAILAGCGKDSTPPPTQGTGPGDWRWPASAGSDGVQYGEQILIPNGSFRMGWASGDPEPDCGSLAQPAFQVTISHDFWLDKYEVTNGAWRSYASATYPPDTLSVPSLLFTNLSTTSQEDIRWYIGTGDTLQYPLMGVSWWGAVYYANWRSRLEGLQEAYTIFDSAGARRVNWDRTKNGYRLPTEAEWEYAARGSQNLLYAWGALPFYDTTRGQPRCAFNSLHYNDPPLPGALAAGIFYRQVGHYRNANNLLTPFLGAGPFGNYDLNGSAAEWVYDYLGNYTAAAKTDPCNDAIGLTRVVRGGSQLSLPIFYGDIAPTLYSYNRQYGDPGIQYGHHPNPPFGSGFRLARNR